MRYLITLIAALFVINSSFAQKSNDKADQLVREGVALHDQGNYKGAVKKYEKALSIDKNNTTAMQEATLSYTALKDYSKAIAYCDKLLAIGNVDQEEQVYVNKGTAQDLMGKPQDAIKTYKEGIKKYPGVYLLHFNLAITYSQTEQPELAIESLQKALSINPEHASSNLVLAYINYYEKKNVRSLLGTYYFLLLEPKGNRAQNALDHLGKLIDEGVQKKGNNTIDIHMTSDRDTSDIFFSARVFLPLMAATKLTGDKDDRSKFDLFYEYTEAVVGYISPLADEHKDDFYVKIYVNFLKKAKEDGYLKPFCYWITQGRYSESAKWLADNTDEATEFITWFQKYTSNNPAMGAKHLRLD